MFSKDKFTIVERENENNILSFQKDFGIVIPPSYLYILFNFGEIKYNYHVKHCFSNENYQGILLDTIPNINTLKIWLENYWESLMQENLNLNKNYIPMLSTYAPNIMFLVGVNKANLDEIYLYDDDFEGFKPLLIATNIFEFFNEKIITQS